MKLYKVTDKIKTSFLIYTIWSHFPIEFVHICIQVCNKHALSHFMHHSPTVNMNTWESIISISNLLYAWYVIHQQMLQIFSQHNNPVCQMGQYQCLLVWFVEQIFPARCIASTWNMLHWGQVMFRKYSISLNAILWIVCMEMITTKCRSWGNITINVPYTWTCCPQPEKYSWSQFI